MIKRNHNPQFVIWLADREGKYLDTILITQKSGKALWGYGENTRSPSCLPIWSYARNIMTAPDYFMPTSDQPVPDAITTATPKSSFIYPWAIPFQLTADEYFINLEINMSYDYNLSFHKYLDKNHCNYHPFNGQPSLLYQGVLKTGKTEEQITLKLIGHGHIKGLDGSINPNLEKITTAKKMLKSVTVRYHP
ncbi:MAG: hypothetical protein MJB14_21435 [Spirochaetes bacterium]|nr:hypothetical protein [Spirochaetota bacterium]